MLNVAINDEKIKNFMVDDIKFLLSTIKKPISITDVFGEIVYVNDSLLTLYGYTEKELISQSTKIFKSGLTNETVYKDLWEHISFGKNWIGNLINKTKERDFITIELEIYPIIIDDEIIGYIGIQKNISDKLFDEQTLLDRLKYDELSNTINRVEFEKLINDKLLKSKKNDESFTIAYFDIDNLSIINDILGFDAGDEVLKEFVFLLKNNISYDDIVSRIFGDNFAIIFENKNINMVLFLVKKIKQKIDSWSFIWNDKKYKITASIGVLVVDKKTTSFSQLLSHCEMIMKIAKDSGKNTIEVFMRDEIYDIEREKMKNYIKIQDILNNKNIYLFVQKISSLKNDIDHYEILMRIYDEENDNLFSTQKFLDLCNLYDKTLELDLFIFEKMNHVLEKIKNNNVKKVHLSMNICSKTLTDLSFSFLIIKELANKEHKNYISFEIVEDSFERNEGNTLQAIFNLKKAGFEIHIDDFGSGYSNLHRLNVIKPNYIKIDGSFIKNITNDFSKSIVKSVVDISRTINAKVIAEFVSTEEILTEVLNSNIDYAQGFYIEKPKPICTLFCLKPDSEKLCLGDISDLERVKMMRNCNSMNVI